MGPGKMVGLKPRRLPAITAWTVALLVAGCGAQPKLVPVVGKVSHMGQPVTAGSVILIPDAGNSYLKDNPSSLLQTDGSFAFKTFPFGDGVPPGKYTAILAPELAGRLKAAAHGKAGTSPWKLDVPGTGLKDVALVVK